MEVSPGRKYFWEEQPPEGWLGTVTLIFLIGFLIQSVNEVQWVPEYRVVTATGSVAALAAFIFARGRLSAWLSWILISAWICVAGLFYFVGFSPWLLIFGWNAFQQPIARNWNLLTVRVLSWISAVISGETTTETLVFAAGLGLLAGVVIALSVWMIYRHRRPLSGLLPLIVLFGINTFYGGGSVANAGIFFGVAAFNVAVFRRFQLEEKWLAAEIDYSEDARADTVVTIFFMSAALVLIALLIPTIPVTDMARRFQRSAPIQAIEGELERIFAGVQSPRSSESRDNPRTGPAGVLPREHLLGNPPELAEIEVFEAFVAEPITAATHWRMVSYDTYTGAGWLLTGEDSQPEDAAVDLLPDLPTAMKVIEQEVRWLQGRAPTALPTLGLPQTFDLATDVRRRSVNDVSRVSPLVQPLIDLDDQNYFVYAATSVAIDVGLDQLPETAGERLSPEQLELYTELPDSVPQRVLDLAQDVTEDAETAYEQAQAIESFLRQYPYSLNVLPPPPDTDPVDYFLFDLQAGYCDYYASSMVVLARSLGLPARLGVGYIVPPEAAGQQRYTVYELQGHSWAEIYFDDYGWVEFEPTAAYPTTLPLFDGLREVLSPETEMAERPLPIPTDEDEIIRRFFVGTGLIILAFMAIGLLYWRDRQTPANGTMWSYARVRTAARLAGYEHIQDATTPQELRSDLVSYARAHRQRDPVAIEIDEFSSGLDELTEIVQRSAFDRPVPSEEQIARDSAAYGRWRSLRWAFVKLKIQGWLGYKNEG